MVRESFAILLVGVLLIVVFLRSKHFGYALATVPVFVVPAVHLIALGIRYFSPSVILGFRPALFTAFCDVLGIAAACVFVVLLGVRIQSKRNRTLYMSTILIYVVILGWAYVFHTLQPMLG